MALTATIGSMLALAHAGDDPNSLKCDTDRFGLTFTALTNDEGGGKSVDEVIMSSLDALDQGGSLKDFSFSDPQDTAQAVTNVGEDTTYVLRVNDVPKASITLRSLSDGTFGLVSGSLCG